jgi:hypothetical protein
MAARRKEAAASKRVVADLKIGHYRRCVKLAGMVTENY